MDEKKPCAEAVMLFAKQSVDVASATMMDKSAFDQACDDEEFAVGPFREAFGDGYGEPYRPFRQAFGVLKDGSCVWCWIRSPNE